MQRGIIIRKNLILNIIWIYDLLRYYYCTGNIEILKKLLKTKEETIENYFFPEEVNKYQVIIEQPNTI